MKHISFFACEDGAHLGIWRLQVYWLRGRVNWRPWRSPADGALYWLLFCFEWRKA